MSLTELIMNCMAGLGLLLVGIKMVTRNLGAVVGDHLRRGIAWATTRPVVAALLGMASGFVVQSGRTTSFIMASFVHVGAIEARRAIPVVLWSNFGCALVIFAAIFPLHLFALFLLAVAGVAVAFERPRSLLNLANATFGLALMLFGLKMTSSTAVLLTNLDGFYATLAQISKSLPLSFLAGLILTLVAQSHMAVTLLSVTLAARGVFGFESALMLIVGTQAGSGIITFLTGIHFRGVPRQMVIAQIFYNVAGVVLFLALFIPAHLLGEAEPGRLGTSRVELQVAIAAVALNFLTPLVLNLFQHSYSSFCGWLSPPLQEDELAKAQYLHAEVGDNASVTLLLAEKEQFRLLQRLPTYCEWSREGAERKDDGTIQRFQQAFALVSTEIDRTQRALMSQAISPEDTEWMLNQQKRMQILIALHAACSDLMQTVRNISPVIEPLRDNTVEALDTYLLTTIDALARRDRDELDLVETMTGQNSAIMERIRKRYMALIDNIAAKERGEIMQITSTFERAVWALRNYAGLLREAPELFDN